MPLTIPQLRTIEGLLRCGAEQIEEAGSIVSAVSPRSLAETDILLPLKEIERRMQEERANIVRLLAAAAEKAETARGRAS